MKILSLTSKSSTQTVTDKTPTQTPIDKPFIQQFDLIISTLSPVHIGCGEDYEPTNYVIENDKLHYFNESLLASVLTDSDRKSLMQLIDSAANPLPSIQKFIVDRKAKLIATGKTKTVAISESVSRKYQSSVGKIVHAGNSAINTLEIERTTFHPHSGLPILPGSSLKGSIRTALLNHWLKEGFRNPEELLYDAQGRSFDRTKAIKSADAKSIEATILDGKFHTDPLRILKIADSSYQIKEGRNVSQIQWQINRLKSQRRDGKQSNASIKTLVECIPEKQGMNFRSKMTLQEIGLHLNANGKRDIPNKQLNKQILVEACNRYYLKEWHKERQIIESQGYVDKDWLKWMDNMLSSDGSFGKLIATHQGMLLRVGKHTGAETITLDDISQIKIMTGRGKTPRYDSKVTTIWLASQTDRADEVNGKLLPFGWIFAQVKALD